MIEAGGLAGLYLVRYIRLVRLPREDVFADLYKPALVPVGFEDDSLAALRLLEFSVWYGIRYAAGIKRHGIVVHIRKPYLIGQGS